MPHKCCTNGAQILHSTSYRFREKHYGDMAKQPGAAPTIIPTSGDLRVALIFFCATQNVPSTSIRFSDNRTLILHRFREKHCWIRTAMWLKTACTRPRSRTPENASGLPWATCPVVGLASSTWPTWTSTWPPSSPCGTRPPDDSSDQVRITMVVMLF